MSTGSFNPDARGPSSTGLVNHLWTEPFRCGRRMPFCGRTAARREFAKIVGETPLRRRVPRAYNFSHALPPGRAGSLEVKVHTTGQLVAVSTVTATGTGAERGRSEGHRSPIN